MSGQPAGEMAVLLVDDEEMLLSGPACALRRAGYDVETALGGELALRQMARRRPDLVLLDWDMPGMDGIELCRRIKADPAFVEVLVVFFSGIYGLERSKVVAREAGADGYIERPILNHELVALIDGHARDPGFHPPPRIDQL